MCSPWMSSQWTSSHIAVVCVDIAVNCGVVEVSMERCSFLLNPMAKQKLSVVHPCDKGQNLLKSALAYGPY